MDGREQQHYETFATKALTRTIAEYDRIGKERAKVQRVWNWIFAVISFFSILACGMGIRFFLTQGAKWDDHMELQTRMMIERNNREIAKFKQDSIMANAYMKEMNAWKKLPYYQKDK